MKGLYTIGYEGAGLAEFLATLEQFEIDVLLDDRCHRTPVVNALGELAGLQPQHLGVHEHAQREAHTSAHQDLGQSISAA